MSELRSVTLAGAARAASYPISKALCSYSTLSLSVSLSPYSVLQPEQYRAELGRIRFRTMAPETAQLSGIS
jgi:hypothetical protein